MITKKLSQKSRLLLEKGPAYQNDIDKIEYRTNSQGLIPFKNYFKFSFSTEILNLSCWKYEYYDLIEKKLKPYKIYSPYTHFITRGFTFLNDQNNYYHVKFNDTNRLIISNFYHRIFNSFMNYHVDFNTIFTFDWKKDYQWFGTSRLLTYAINETVVNKNIDINKFLADYYLKFKKGTGYVIGNTEERQKLDRQKRGFLMPFVQTEKGITIKNNEFFYSYKKYLEGRRSFLNDCQYIKTVTLNTEALKELNSLNPLFTSQQLDCWKVPTDEYTYWKGDDLLTPNSSFLNYSDFHLIFLSFIMKKITIRGYGLIKVFVTY